MSGELPAALRRLRSVDGLVRSVEGPGGREVSPVLRLR